MRTLATKQCAINQYNGLGNQLWDIAGVRPSLDLNFANSKNLVDATTGQNLVTFTRASRGTYVDSQGVIRTAVTNLLLQSEDFSTTWTNTNSTESTNVVVSPNGTLTADLLLADATTTTSARDLRQNANGTVASTHTFSVYAKAKDGNFLGMTFRNQAAAVNFCSAEFNLSNGTVSVVGSNGGNATGALASIADAGGGWYRCSLSGIADTSGTQFTVILIGRTNSNSNSVAANTELVYLWGAQLEQSTTVGEYIPTTSTINSAPRFDHNPTTGESLGLLVEESRTNLCLQSEDLSNIWTVTRATVSTNAVAAPSGPTVADKLAEDATATSTHFVQQSISVTSGTSYTFSVYAKAAERNYTQLVLSGQFTVTTSAIFDLSTGAVGATTGSPSTSAVLLPNGWWKLSITATASATGATLAQLRVANSSATATYTGDGTSGIYLWGAQLEAGSFPTSYIPTTTATVTRSADVASITGSNWSSWGSSTTGTYYLEAAVTRSSASVSKVFLGASTSPAESYYLYQVQNQSDLRTFDSTSVLDTVNVISDGITFKGAAAYSSATLTRSLVLDGGTVTEGAFDGIYGSDLFIGSRSAGGAPTTGTIRRLVYWGQRLPNNVLQAITQ